MSQETERKPQCAVRGVLHGGRAICGSVINASKCGFDGECMHQRESIQLVECDQCPTSGGCVNVCMRADQQRSN